MSVADPIVRLPPELTLRILEFAPISSLANLTAVSKAWHNFIDVTHQEAIYSKRTGTTGPHGSEDMTKVSSYSQYLESAESSKSLCQRQGLLSRSWRSDRPMTTKTVLEPGGGGYFQFRADFTRRFFISTSEKGELNVTDMKSGTLLWSLTSTLVSNVDSEQPCGLLEYEDSVAVFARDDNVLEVWQTDAGVLRRGEFRRWAVLTHEEEIWDAHIFGGVLRCVLSTGESLVYDLRRQAPKLTQRIQIAERDITYMYQDAKVVVYSMGRLGLYVHDQQSGELLGILKPGPEVSRYHILRPCDIRLPGPPRVHSNTAAGEEADDDIEDEVDDEADDQTDDEVNDAADETTDNGSDDEDEDDGTYETRVLRILSFAPPAAKTHRPLREAPTLSSDEMTASLTSQMGRWAVASLFVENKGEDHARLALTAGATSAE
ncbi:hypothetical protein B0A54_15817 [Friedmanniomyces endolithicus]|uniref:F-box domain-containing protein n=1 Tax=Friedmanniomyces endolithicus TaxID=329885 RepID=A0A4U0U5U1_9PEZI|nr:hypothetical protein B0A54_15817 [Friedmanniomyces endolithicus]